MKNPGTPQVVILNLQDLDRFKQEIVEEVGNLVKELSKSVTQKEFLTADEAKEFLGCSKATLFRYLNDGLPSQKRGRKRYFKYSDLTNWIKNQ